MNVYATPSEVAEALHTTVPSLAQDRYLGQGLPYTKLGRRVLYSWADVYDYLDAHRVVPGDAGSKGVA
ncbi:DNA-binding protein [Tsukamurella tyrosinosolvens]|uniref:DNA-binding protein n=1 Tax=Tsukamurella tyrosinosolvens TaxID=57704 RepID=UPI0034631AA1